MADNFWDQFETTGESPAQVKQETGDIWSQFQTRDEVLSASPSTGVSQQSRFSKGVEAVGQFVKEAPVLGRITKAGEAIQSQVESSFDRGKGAIGQTFEGIKELDTTKTFGGVLKGLGAAGEFVTAPIAAPFGAAEPELQKAVEAIPEPIKQKIAQTWESIPEDQRDRYEDFLMATGLFSLIPAASRGVVKEAAKKIVEKVPTEPLAIAGKAIEEGAEATIKKTKDEFVRELVRPEQTLKVKKEQVARTTPGKGIFDKDIVEPTARELDIEKFVSEIPDVDPKNTFQQNYSAIRNANINEAKTLEKLIQENDFIFPKKELISKINEAKKKLSESPVITGDAENVANKLIGKLEKMITEGESKGSTLLQIRKDYDNWVKSQKPKAFDAAAENAFTIANRELRGALNDFLDEKALNVDVKASLKKQSSLYEALDNIEIKAAKEADTAFQRMLQRFEDRLGTRNKFTQGLALLTGVGALGAAQAYAPAFTALLASGILLKQAGKTVFNPKVRKAFGEALQDLDALKNRMVISSAEFDDVVNGAMDLEKSTGALLIPPSVRELMNIEEPEDIKGASPLENMIKHKKTLEKAIEQSDRELGQQAVPE